MTEDPQRANHFVVNKTPSGLDAPTSAPAGLSQHNISSMYAAGNVSKRSTLAATPIALDGCRGGCCRNVLTARVLTVSKGSPLSTCIFVYLSSDWIHTTAVSDIFQLGGPTMFITGAGHHVACGACNKRSTHFVRRGELVGESISRQCWVILLSMDLYAE